MFKGAITALITPFKDGEIDWPAFENLVEWQVEQGIHGLVPTGTTGECPTLSHDEHMAIVQRCVEIVKKRVPVIAGTGSNSTREAIELTQHAKEAGADGALIVTPYYNKPTQEGLIEHYKAIHEAVDIPIVIYNIPGRCVIDMSVETMARLAELPRIVGVKDSSGDGERPVATRLACGSDFIQLSGEDPAIGAFLGQGGHGIISVLANIVPKLSAERHEAWEKGDIKTFEKIRDQLAPLASGLFVESSPAPVKYAASVLGLCTDQLRRPLLPASDSARKIVDEAMAHAGLGPANTNGKASAAG
ncbi:MAG: 4-hydroxy-tetrahydrodipicolinate synthase [Micavibrio sp.]|nr:MAG: 4-hydroxy-tetrahydrodipicolinate synthase [Micavibrio sp.]